ncbi:hypothetical protein O181_053066, partial [Austropuccinia psidii MF-1]|nr:hypothetical protein [Austropuccinia psidii MF-1]
FEDNPTEDNQTTVERLVEETCPSSSTPIVTKKKKANKLDFPGPTIQDSEEGSNRHLHEAVQAVLHCVHGQGLGNVATNPPRSDELLENPQKVIQRGGNSEILQWIKYTIIQTSNQKDQGIPCKKERGKQGRSPSSSYQQASSQPASQEGKKNKKRNWNRPYSSSYRILKIQKKCHGQCLQHGQNHDGIQVQRGTKNATTSFPKETTFTPDVVNT